MNAPLVCCLLAALAAGCASVPTLAERQEAWRKFRKDVTFVCSVGMQADPAMPEDVTDWCVEVAK